MPFSPLSRRLRKCLLPHQKRRCLSPREAAGGGGSLEAEGRPLGTRATFRSGGSGRGASRAPRRRPAGGGAGPWSPAPRGRGRASAPPAAHLPRPASCRRGSRRPGLRARPARPRRRPAPRASRQRRAPYPRPRQPGACSMGECGASGPGGPAKQARGPGRLRASSGKGRAGGAAGAGRAGPAPNPPRGAARCVPSSGEVLPEVGGARRPRSQGGGGPNCVPLLAPHQPAPLTPARTLAGAGGRFAPSPPPPLLHPRP